MHAVPPLMTGNYVPPRSDFGIDDEETLESMSEPVINEPKVVNQPKVWSDAPIIEEYESDSDDKHVIKPSKEQEKPSFAFVNTVELNKQKGKGTGQGENRPVWNNVQRLNPQNKFVPTAVLTRTGRLPVNTAKHNVNSQPVSTSAARKVNDVRPIVNDKDPHKALKNKGIVDSGCSKHMTGNKAYLVEYQDYNGGPVAFGGSKGYITGKENIVPTRGLACLIAKATVDESNKWHRRLGHVNFENVNKLVKGNLVRGLPSKIFQNGHTCVACQKGKQHKASFVRLPDPKLKTLGEKGIECIFVGYAKHYKAFRDANFDEKRFSSVPRPSQMSLKDGTEDIGCSVIPEEVVQQPEPELRRSKRN
ncbi:ribonuclease H-like domain-containing protein, partial [Tanacetum coccineum]